MRPIRKRGEVLCCIIVAVLHLIWMPVFCIGNLWFNIKYCTSLGLNSTKWLGLFTNKTFRKHRNLINPHRDFVICIVSLAIFHPHFSICNFFHRHFSICIFLSAFFFPHFIIRIFFRIFLSAIRHQPPSGPHFTETHTGFLVPLTGFSRLKVNNLLSWFSITN